MVDVPDQRLRGEPLAGVARRVLVYRGSEERKTSDGIEVWPLRRFLDALEGGRLWPGDP